MGDPGVPAWRDLRTIVLVLGVVDPAVPSRNLLLSIVVLKVTVAELVGSYESPRFRISNVLHLAPPFFQASALNRSYGTPEANHDRDRKSVV